ncbi:MAG: hypothetical protein ACI4HM_00880 [Ruminococcus sp.]
MNRKSIVYRCLVALLCLVCMVVFTYSWFNRESRATDSPGDRMSYSDEVDVNSSANLNMETFLGSEDANGEITYSSTATSVDSHRIDNLEPGAKVYYKTKISNSGDTRCKATLLLRNSQYSSLNGYINFGVTKPMNTLKSYDSGSDVELVRNVSVPAKLGTTDGTAYVEWYVYLDGSYTGTSGSITLGNLYLFAN